MSDDRLWGELVAALHDGAGAGGLDASGRVQSVDLGEALDQIAAVDRHYRALVETLPVVSFVAEWDGTLVLRYVSPQIEAMLGHRQRDWLSDRALWEGSLHPEDRQRVSAEVGRSWAESRGLQIEYRMIARDGREVWLRHEAAAPPGPDEARRWAMGALIDVTERRRAERALGEERERTQRYRELVSVEKEPGARPGGRDAVTGLPDRAELVRRLDAAVDATEAGGGEIAVLCVDIDAFKLVNDSLGHAAGDAVLFSLGSRLSELIGPADVVGRPGGDEFLVLLTDLDRDAADAAEMTAERIVEALRAPFEIEGMEFELGATVGASLFPRDARDCDALLKHADAAMYDAKEGGPGGFALYTGGTLEAYERLSETTRLRRAIADGELRLHFQPIFRLPEGSVSAVEALVRWEHPERGLVLPIEFVPLAEQTGLIEGLGDWVIEAMCAQARAWLDAGLDPHVSFNVSPRQLRRREFASRLESTMSSHRVEPAAFTLEITESTAMQEPPERVEPTLRHLRDIGLRLAIDDFGTGYSSLTRLRTLPVQELKIDRSLLSGVPNDGEAAGIVVAALGLAAALGMDAVAEGVESERQREFLVERGCRRSQGFHLSRPLPALEAEAVIPRRVEAAG